MDMIRCTACRGMKKVPKLGGMIGDCNLCEGTGRIIEGQRQNIASIAAPCANEIIKAVDRVTNNADEQLMDGSEKIAGAQFVDVTETTEDVKPEIQKFVSNGKRAVFKRKKG